jgi:prepilin signal peptidase PulO-like enzyme (type II secretory pathway)
VTPILLSAVLGLCIGNLINLIAINLLSEQSWLSFRLRCEKCDHELGFADQIPLLSFVLSGGRCRYCKQSMSWLSPFIELSTAVMFVAFINKWDPGWYLAGMLVLGCTLIASTATDIRARLIPHDITYPSMLCGLIFSGCIRHDLPGALIGVGIGYVVFDFLAHFGRKLYLAMHPSLHEDNTESEVELLGGADAVLAAVIASWLGWMELLTALVISFIVGSIMAVGFAFHRAYIHGEPGKATRAGVIGAFAGAVVLGVPIMLMGPMIGNVTLLIGIAILFGLLFGFALGVIAAGPQDAQPFPFGPALALGGFVAMFYHVNYALPRWSF